MREKLLDPTGTSDRAVDTTLAPRLRSLRGLTAGLFRKSYFGHPVEESLIQRILHSCDFAVAAIGD